MKTHSSKDESSCRFIHDNCFDTQKHEDAWDFLPPHIWGNVINLYSYTHKLSHSGKNVHSFYDLSRLADYCFYTKSFPAFYFVHLLTSRFVIFRYTAPTADCSALSTWPQANKTISDLEMMYSHNLLLIVKCLML